MEEENNDRTSPPGAVECDPEHRYWRFEDVLGRGAFKTVFKAFDSQEGTEVAWNKVLLCTTINEDPNLKRLFSEIRVLQKLKHKNIMTFHDYWLDERTNTLNFITELFTHGSLKKFRAKHKHLELNVLKKWAWQILQGLVYLHGHEPPIIHRDLKCDNILINGVTGDIKIGDLGLATLWKGLAPLSVIGTPEFMAPEFYDEKYDEKVDVYAFGMLLLELVSMEYPYSECSNPAAIYKRVTQGVFPASIQKIKMPELREFIELCIAYEPSERPEARKLLKHPFFDDIRKTMGPPDRFNSDDLDMEPNGRSSDYSSHSRMDPLSRHGSSLIMHSESESEEEEEAIPEEPTEGMNITIDCQKVEGEPTLRFTLTYDRPGGIQKKICFPFNIEEDTAEQIISELRAESLHSDLGFMINEHEATVIGEKIGEEVAKWQWEDKCGMTTYVNVVRTTCESISESPSPLHPVNSFDCREALTSQMGDMCEEVKSQLMEPGSDVFRTLAKTRRTMMDCVTADPNRRTAKPRTAEPDQPSDDCLTENSVLFQASDQIPRRDSSDNGMERRLSISEISVSSSAIDIPRKRRLSTSSTIERSHSISSTVSDSKVQLSGDGRSFVGSRSIQRRLSGRQFYSEGPTSVGRGQLYRSTAESIRIADSTEDSAVYQPVELSVILVEPEGEAETPISNSAGEGKSETDSTLDRQLSNTSLISMVTMKPPSKKGPEGWMPTVPENPNNSASPNQTQVHQREPDPNAVSKATEWQKSIANGRIFNDVESGATLRNTSSQGSIRQEGSGSSTVDHGMKSPALSQDLDSCGRSDINANLTTSLKEEKGACKVQSSNQPSLEDHDGNTRTSSLSSDVSTEVTNEKAKKQESRSSQLNWGSVLSGRSVKDCRSDLSAWQPESIRAFRKEGGEGTVEVGPSFQRHDSQTQMTSEAKLRVDMLFKSYPGLLAQGVGDESPFLWSSQTRHGSFAMRESPDYSLDGITDPHPYLDLPPTPKHSSSHVLCLDRAISDDPDPWAELCKRQTGDDLSSLQRSETKELRRKKASENIDKMQEQQLAGLCAGAFGMPSKSTGKSQQLSMKGSGHL